MMKMLRSIKGKLMIYSIIISIIPLSVLGYFNIRTARNNLEQSITANSQITVQRLAADQKTIIGGQIERVENIAWIYGASLLDEERISQEGILYSLLGEALYLEEVSLLQADGKELARASRRQVVGNQLRELRNTEAFRQLKKGNTLWSQTFLDQYGQVRLKRIIPIYSLSTGDLRGAFLIEISLRPVVEQLAARQPEQKGRIFLVDSRGKLIGHQDFSQVLKQTDVKKCGAVQEFMQEKIPKFRSQVNRYISYDGQEVLGVFAPISELGWAVIQEVPVKKAFAPVNKLVQQLILAGISIIILAALLSIFFSVKFTNYLRALEKSVKYIRNGNLDRQIKVKGDDELSHLAETLDIMRSELYIRRQQEQALRQAEKLSSLGLLASGVAHELNNPLGIVSAYAEDLQERLEEEDGDKLTTSSEVGDYLQIIIKQVKRCKEITVGLLNFARQSKAEKEKVDLQDVVNNTLKLVKYRIKTENIKTEVNIPDNLPYFIANMGEVQQVLLNIITNALDALKSGGFLKFSAKLIDDQILLTIEDNGCGIRAEDLKKIYDPFFTTKEQEKGTGLGLSICYGIMQKLGGQISIKSTFGQGTIISLYFPVEKRE